MDTQTNTPPQPIPSTGSGPAAQPVSPTPTAPAAAPAPGTIQSPATQPAGSSGSAGSPSPTNAGKPHKRSFLLLIVIFLVVLAIAGGAVYVMNMSKQTQLMDKYKKPTPVVTKKTVTEEDEIKAVETGDPSDDITGIEKDLNEIQ